MTDEQQLKRFTNYILMLEHEVMADLKDDANALEDKFLMKRLVQKETSALVRVVIVKTVANLQKKYAFEKSFLDTMFGVKVEDD